ncbi:hypothetical protein CH253_04960 [Rhodococcus sp. 06-156-3C]|nr:hypothetical protein CH280_20120 [Rhodococcus sp. 06-156-4C]OZD14466.1 hypothetical protein CH248_24190 [Rhodococcus sp. 06-156-4a]OZD24800.1 hypothetical protein CH253_04960 [Rhodococcus sp. 06-156-3C]OZD27774.1 hypothetical protein CH247_21100 [Rhodococcus sp. 06-156-3b]OZD39755.1 hypothetical protein CH284_04680 [Rhodococcus sp. 06-156-3]OZF60901.1 hypothetical protein CH290_16560 [Rhodococcus sp. 06-156-4]
MSKRYPAEQRERAVKTVLDDLHEYNSVYSAYKAIGPKLGVGAESLRLRTRQAQIDANQPPRSNDRGATAHQGTRTREPRSQGSQRDSEVGINFLREGARPSPPLIVQFIDQMRALNYRIESICRVLTEHGVQVAPRTYCNWKSAPPSARTISDAYLTDALRGTVGEPEELDGRRKMYRHLRRKGHSAAACTVDRLMGDGGMSGVVRGRRHRTTIQGGKNATRALTCSTVISLPTPRIENGSPTSRTPERGLDSTTSRSSSTASPEPSSDGTPR